MNSLQICIAWLNIIVIVDCETRWFVIELLTGYVIQQKLQLVVDSAFEKAVTAAVVMQL